MIRAWSVALALLAWPPAAPAAAAPQPTEWSARSCNLAHVSPVCARTRSGQLSTLTYSCVAKGTRARIVHNGPCRTRR